MIRIEGKIRGCAKERIRCDFCGHEQVSVYPYDGYIEGLECGDCGMIIALYSAYINHEGVVTDAPIIHKRF